MSFLKCAVVGAGYFGSFHAEKYAQLPGCDLVAVADTDAAARARAAQALGVDGCADYRELYGRIDAASIAAPTSSHYRIARGLLENGIHVLVEKPMAQTTAEADALTELAARRKLVLQVGHIERFNPALTALGERLRAPEYIEIVRLTPYRERSADVGVILDLMVHDLDLVLSLTNAEVETIHAKGVELFSREVDIVNAHLVFRDGCAANITGSRVSLKSERKIRVFNANGYFSIDMVAHTIRQCRVASRAEQRLEVSDDSYADADPLRDEIAHFIECITQGRSPLVDGVQGRRALALAERVHQAVHCGRRRGSEHER